MAHDRRPERQGAVRRRLETAGLDALLITHLPNIRYLSGFTGSAGVLLLGLQRAILLTDARYTVQAREEAESGVEVVIEPLNMQNRLKAVLSDLRPGVLGFERNRVTVRGAEQLTDARSGKLEPVEGLVEAERIHKDAVEVAALRRAAELAASAVEAVLPGIRAGDPELRIAGRLEAALRERGSEGHPFPTIIASGPRSALPHAATTARPVGTGELLLLDFGAQVDGYCADLTRTVVVGRADARQREVYQAVREAQQESFRGIRAGMTGREADATARDVLERLGMGAAFGHSLGHGLGLEVHEDPRLSKAAEDPLPAGAVVTVEPGAYFEGWGGVRLEDDVVLGSAGLDHLSPPAPPLLELT